MNLFQRIGRMIFSEDVQFGKLETGTLNSLKVDG